VVREARQSKGMTQEGLAFAADRSPRFISNLERGQGGMSVRTLFALAGALDVRPSTLIRRAEKAIIETS
jgi:transcriptional regulator with XRE-family HTH domain